MFLKSLLCSARLHLYDRLYAADKHKKKTKKHLWYVCNIVKFDYHLEVLLITIKIFYNIMNVFINILI